MKNLLRKIYSILPFKRTIFTFIRAVWTPPESIWQHFYFEGKFTFKVNGRTIRLQNHNSLMETAIFWTNTYLDEKVSMKLWNKLSEKSNWIFDIGANTGMFSILGKSMNPKATVHAFEPITRIFARLKENVEMNHLDVNLHEIAMSNESGTAKIFDIASDHHYHASLKESEVAHHEGVTYTEIKTDTLNNFVGSVNAEGCDLMKIDVEGFEIEVINGALDVIKKYRPSILIEVKNDENAAEIEILLSGLDYRYYDIDEVNAKPKKIDRLRKSSKWNLLFLNEAHEKWLVESGML